MPGRRRPSNRYELLTCAWSGHVLVGTDAATITADDAPERIANLCGRIAHVHLSDCDGKKHGDLPPGLGVVDFPPYLRALADETGGRLYNADTVTDIKASFGAIMDELGRQYSLGYYPRGQVRPGDAGRAIIRGPGFANLDASAMKNFQVKERMNLQLRADFFNILNHPYFSNPVLPAFIADPSANIISPLKPGGSCGCGFVLPPGGTQEVGNGGYQITATGDVGIGNPFLGGGGPRGIQLAAKFTF